MYTTETRARNTVVRYVVALLLSALAAVGQTRVGSLLGETTPFLALPAVVGAAWFGGFGPGVLAAIVSAAIAGWLIAPALNTRGQADAVSGVLFVLTALLICVAMRQLRRCARDERRRRMETERLLRRKGVLEALATALSAAHTSVDVTSAYASELMQATGAAAGAVALLAANGAELEIVQAFGYEESITGRFSLPSNSPLATALRHRELVAAPPAGASRDVPLEADPILSRHEGFVIVP